MKATQLFFRRLLRRLVLTSVSFIGATSPTSLAAANIDGDDVAFECAADDDGRLAVLASRARAPLSALTLELGRGLGQLLAQLSAFERIIAIDAWVSSHLVARRVAIAVALAEPFASLAAGAAIEVLANDPSVEVRAAVTLAARARLARDAEVCFPVLHRLAQDRDERVRRLAAYSFLRA
jgi:hypothetical protein